MLGPQRRKERAAERLVSDGFGAWFCLSGDVLVWALLKYLFRIIFSRVLKLILVFLCVFGPVYRFFSGGL